MCSPCSVSTYSTCQCLSNVLHESCDACRLKSHKAELQEKEKAWKESEKAYKKERESLDKAEKELMKLEVHACM